MNRPIHLLRSNQASSTHTAPSPSKIHTFNSKTPVNCPTTNKITGITKNTVLCWDSSTLCAFAEPRTISVSAIKEIAGETIRSLCGITCHLISRCQQWLGRADFQFISIQKIQHLCRLSESQQAVSFHLESFLTKAWIIGSIFYTQKKLLCLFQNLF